MLLCFFLSESQHLGQATSPFLKCLPSTAFLRLPLGAGAGIGSPSSKAPELLQPLS